jgi:hypothetical protein
VRKGERSCDRWSIPGPPIDAFASQRSRDVLGKPQTQPRRHALLAGCLGQRTKNHGRASVVHLAGSDASPIAGIDREGDATVGSHQAREPDYGGRLGVAGRKQSFALVRANNDVLSTQCENSAPTPALEPRLPKQARKKLSWAALDFERDVRQEQNGCAPGRKCAKAVRARLDLIDGRSLVERPRRANIGHDDGESPTLRGLDEAESRIFESTQKRPLDTLARRAFLAPEATSQDSARVDAHEWHRIGDPRDRRPTSKAALPLDKGDDPPLEALSLRGCEGPVEQAA